MKKKSLFYKLIKNNSIIRIKLLLKIGILNPAEDNNLPIRLAAEDGMINIFKLLLNDPRIDPSDWKNWAIRLSSQNGHFDIVKLLLKDKRVDPSVRDNEALTEASQNGHFDIVELLLSDPRVDPSDNYNHAIVHSYKINPLEFRYNEYLLSYSKNLDKVVNLLFKDKRVKNSLKIDDEKIYNKLNLKNIRNKVSGF